MKPQQSAEPNRLGVWIAAALLGVVAVWWVGAQCGALATHQQLADASLADAAVALGDLHAHLGDPAAAWPAPARPSLAGPVAYWVATMLTVAAAAAGATLIASRRQDAGRGDGGFAGRRDLRTLTVGAPTLGRVTLGTVGRRLVAAEPQTSLAVVGPTGCGKTVGFAIPALLEWDGPVIATSVKTDLLGAGLAARQARGTVWIYDPTGASGRESAGWSPLAACDTWAGAMRVAAWLCDAAQPRRDTVSDGDYWYAQARKALAPHLYAAAIGGRSMRDVVAWIDEQSHDIETILRTDHTTTYHPTSGSSDETEGRRSRRDEIRDECIEELRADAHHDDDLRWAIQSEGHWPDQQQLRLDAQVDARLAEELDAATPATGASPALTAARALWHKEPRLRGSVYATIENVLAGYADPHVADTTDPVPTQIDVADWLSGNHTIFVVAPAHEQARLRPVLTVLLQHAIRAAYEHANTTGGTLRHPCLVLLDEAGNIAPVRDLPTYASTARSHGITLVTVWQDLAQLRALYGDQARTVLNNHRAKLFGAGIADDQTLEYISRLVGDEARTELNLSGELHGPRRTISEHRTYRRAAPAELLRRMPRDEAILLYGNLAPARLQLRPWYRTHQSGWWQRVVPWRGARRA
jgi:type IV secretion system protein VirD4